MIRTLTLFAISLALCAAAPAPRVDYGRLVEVIIQVENTPWSRPGGALQWTQVAWREETSRPYSQARDRAMSVPLAEQRLRRLAELLLEGGVEPSPYFLACAWRRGLEGAYLRARKNIADDYAWRARNLYDDPTFSP